MHTVLCSKFSQRHFTGNDDSSIADAGITDDSNLFVWDGVQVAGETVQVGTSCEPVLLHVTYPAPSSSRDGSSGVAGEDCEYELVSGFPKNSTLKELRVRSYSRELIRTAEIPLIKFCHAYMF